MAGAQDRPTDDGPGLEEELPELDDGDERPRTALVIALAVGLVAALLVVVLATRDPSTERVTESPLLGRVAPAVAGETLGGGSFDLGDQRGRWALVNFFATWCVPCEVEHPELIEFSSSHRTTGDAVVVSVLFDDEPAKAERFFERRGGDWPVVIDPDGGIGVAYGVARVPESFLVAPDGTVVQRIVGGVTADGLDRLLEQYEAAAAGGSS